MALIGPKLHLRRQRIQTNERRADLLAEDIVDSSESRISLLVEL
jgi:hypothetical protein